MFESPSEVKFSHLNRKPFTRQRLIMLNARTRTDRRTRTRIRAGKSLHHMDELAVGQQLSCTACPTVNEQSHAVFRCSIFGQCFPVTRYHGLWTIMCAVWVLAAKIFVTDSGTATKFKDDDVVINDDVRRSLDPDGSAATAHTRRIQ